MKKMSKKLIAIFMTVAMLFALTACSDGKGSDAGGDGDKTLNVIAWSSLFTDKECQAIKEATGITINFTPFNSLEELFTKVKSSGVDYDLVVVGDYMLSTMVDQGLLKKLDQTKLTNTIADVSNAFKNQNYDPNLEYCIPQSGGTVGILVNRDKIDMEITSWEDLFDSSLQDQIVMLDDQRIVLGIGNVLLGNDFNETDPDKIKASEKKMEEIIPNIKSFTSFDQYDSFLNGEANIMVGWSYEAYMALQSFEGNWEYIYPEEGMHVYMDNYALTANTQKDDLAYELIEYMCGEEFNEVMWSESPGSRLASKAATEKIEVPEDQQSVVYPPEEQYTKGLYLINLGEDMTTYDECWTEFKQKASLE